MKKFIALGLACLISDFWPLTSAHAQVPQLINYQGRLLSGTNLVNGNVGLSLRLFNVPSSGSSIYEDSNTVAVADGLYSTFIGDNPISNSFLTALTNAQVWVEMAVNGIALAPRERLASVGYSLATRGLLVATNDSVVVNPAQNTIAASYADRSTIGGGRDNSIQTGAYDSFLGGGYENSVGTNAAYSVVPGGQNNAVGNDATNAFAAGYRAKAKHPGTFVWADRQEADFASTTNNQFLIRASGGVGIGTNVTGGAMLAVAGTITASGIAGSGSTNLVFSSGVSFATNVSGNFSGSFSGNGAAVSNLDLRVVNTQGAIGWSTNWGAFTLNSSPATGSNPVSVAAADVNGDGRVDLISANYAANTLSVLTNNGNGSFTLSSSPGVGSLPASVAAADVNGDGKVDLISANYGANTLSVLTNNGSGGFTLSSAPGVSGNNPASVAAADVNGDGKMDLISADYGSFQLSVLTNNGNGSFTLSSALVVGSGPFFVTAADLNGDGKADLICANQFDGTLSVLTNKGNASFTLSTNLAVGTAAMAVTAADVNGDGTVDLICVSSLTPGTLAVLTNNGSAGFTLSSSLGVGN